MLPSLSIITLFEHFNRGIDLQHGLAITKGWVLFIVFRAGDFGLCVQTGSGIRVPSLTCLVLAVFFFFGKGSHGNHTLPLYCSFAKGLISGRGLVPCIIIRNMVRASHSTVATLFNQNADGNDWSRHLATCAMI